MKIKINPDIHPLNVSFDWKETKLNDLDFTECTHMEIWHHNSPEHDFSNLPDIPELKSLVIYFSNAETITGLEKYPGLERLELYHVSKMKTISGIEMFGGLNLLSIFNAKKVDSFAEIGQLKNIETLRLCDCGDIQSINFISDMSMLRSFTFGGSNIVDGDLHPLLEHEPPLEIVGFNNKRHYSHTWENVCKQLGLYEFLKCADSIKKLKNNFFCQTEEK